MASEKSINILISVSNKVVLEGLRRILLENPAPTRIVTRENGAESSVPDLILFDINQPIQELRSRYPQARPVLLDTGIDERDINYLLMCHQVRGIIAPTDSVAMFYKALTVVHGGEIWIDQHHLKSLLISAGSMTTAGDIRGLSSQDKKIIKMISRGLRNKEIGDNLCLSEHTIKSHVSRIYKKLNVKNRAQMVSLARDRKLFDMDDFE